MADNDKNMGYHYGSIVRERMNTRKLSPADLAKQSDIPLRRIMKILSEGKVSSDDRQKIEDTLHRIGYITMGSSTEQDFTEQATIIEGIQECALKRLEMACGATLVAEIKVLIEYIIIESSYYGLICTKAGMERQIVEKVKRRRSA